LPRCVKCRRWGLFLKLGANGLCTKCLEEESAKKLQSIPRVEIIISEEEVKSRALYELEGLKFSSITPRGKYPEFVVLDVETTGLRASRDKIVELAAVRFAGGEPAEMFWTLVNPKVPIPEDASAVNGITDEMVKDSPTIKQIIRSFDAFLGGSDLVAHNLKFDLGFIHKAGSCLIDKKRRYFCTLEQSQKLLKKPKKRWNMEEECWEEDWNSDFDVENHRLETLCDYFGIFNPDKHRAYADAYCTGLLFRELVKMKQSSASI